MPSKKQYDLVQNDDYDTRIPLHAEEAFHHGITFHAKYIGMLDVPRPTSRVEIVAAMRRIRYEFKAKAIKKKKVTIEVSVEGVKVTLRKKKKKKHWLDDGKSVILSHPIYRIFYVSHDSQDLKIFSYIARDGASNVFKCAVFKSNKKSQAMRVVRTVGQAFEVCHKLSITAPENDNLDQDEQDTLTQDLLSDRLSDFTTDKNKRDIMCEGDCDKISLPPDEPNFKDLQQDNIQKTTRLPHFDLLPPPPITNTKKSPLISAETYSSPHSDVLTSGNETGSCNLPPAGSALSAHHEIQLLREQLEQQNQQTQAAMAQLQLTREQLTSEKSARVEAQTRTHQLLVHNRELLDHIAALVSHLQGGENASTQHTPAHVTLPQQQHYAPVADNYMADYSDIATLDNNATLQALASNSQGLIENRAVASCLPQSPLLPAFNSTGSYFNFPYPPEVSYEAQLLQRLQALNSCTPPTPFPYNFPQAYPPFFYSPYYSQPLLTNSCTLPNPSSKSYSQSPLPTRHSFHDSPIAERRFNAGRSSEPRQVSHLSRENLNFPQQLYSQSFQNPTMQPQHNSSLQNQTQVNVKQTQNKSGSLQHNLNENVHNQQNSSTSSQKKNSQTNSPQKQSVPNTKDTSIDTQFIRPLPQMGTLTTTDVDGRVTVIVPVPANNNDNNVNNISTEGLLANLRLTDDFRFTGGPITRTTSEKVPNRSELMSQVQRTMWARHTTK